MSRREEMLRLFRSCLEPPRSLDRWDAVAAGFGVLVGAWVFVFKLLAFEQLKYSDDMFQALQIATSWLDGHPFVSNRQGLYLSIHTHFLLAPVGLLTKPLGAAGLWLILAASAALSCFAVARLARRTGTPGWAAALLGFAVGASPRALYHWHDPFYGFHIELVEAPLAVLLLERLLAGRLLGSLVLAAVLLSVKEDVVLLVAAVGVVALVERRLGCSAAIERPASERRAYVPALAVIGMALAYAPLALWILRTSRAADPSAIDGYARVPLLRDAAVHSGPGILVFALGHLGSWLSSDQVTHACLFTVLASFGLVLLRPQLWPLALPLTGIAWLMQGPMGWPPRFVGLLSVAWIAAALGMGSLARLVQDLRERGRRRAALAVVAGALALAGAASVGDLVCVPEAREVYTLSLLPVYSEGERAQLDRVSERYRREARDDEPVVAAPHLFALARTPALCFYEWLKPEMRPIWILWDDVDRDGHTGLRLELSRFVHDLDRYEVVAREGPFTLRRAR